MGSAIKSYDALIIPHIGSSEKLNYTTYKFENAVTEKLNHCTN